MRASCCTSFAPGTLCSAYLIRDVLDEMLLNGMRPNRFILSTGGRPLPAMSALVLICCIAALAAVAASQARQHA